jgi:hypothetical protein
MAKLLQISNASQKMLDGQRQFNPICRQGHECVGWGVDGATGRATAFPIVYLSYDPNRTDKIFEGMSEPLEVIANHVVKPVWSGVDGGNAFARVENYVQHVNTQYAGATPVPKGTNGIYSDAFESVFNEHFQKADDRALSVTRVSMSVISMSLPVDPATKTRKYNIDRHANDFANSLPPRHDTTDQKAQFRYFIEKYGTSFAISATLGGLVEQYSSWKTWLADPSVAGGGLSGEALVRNAQIDFANATGLPGPAVRHDAGYNDATVRVGPLKCLGGDPTVSCAADFAKWTATLKSSPVLLDYELAPISDLVEDPDVKAALDEAVKEYIEEKSAEWDAVEKCPVNCGPPGAGSCASGQSSCSCAYPGVVGRQCTGCAPVNVRGTFTDLNGRASSGLDTLLGCDGQFQSLYYGGGGSCTGWTKVGRRTGCKCDIQGTAVKCSRNSLGNLQAQVHQPGCQCTCSENPYRHCGCETEDGTGPSPDAAQVVSAPTEVTVPIKGCTVDRVKSPSVKGRCEFV